MDSATVNHITKSNITNNGSVHSISSTCTVYLLRPIHSRKDEFGDSVYITAFSLDQIEVVAHSKASLQKERGTTAEQSAIRQDGNAVT